MGNNNNWTKETCFIESQKYKTRSEFAKGSSGAYYAAWKNKWLDEWFERKQKPRGYWNYERCFKEAQKYEILNEFAKGSCGAYSVAIQNNWIKDYTWLERKKKWFKDTCFIEAQKYKTRNEFEKGSSGAYQVARMNGWLDDYTWFEQTKKPKGYWNYEHCSEEARKYKTRSEFEKGNIAAYGIAVRKKWLDDWFEQTQNPKGYWTYERCYEEAQKYQTRNEFKIKSCAAYNTALRKKWFDDYTWFVDGKMKLFTDKIDSVYAYYFSDGAIYIGRTMMKHQSDRHKRHMLDKKDTVYRYAINNGLSVPEMTVLEENLTVIQGLEKEHYYFNFYKEQGCNVINKGKTGVGCGSLGNIDNGKWTKEKCFEEANKYKNRSSFKRAKPYLYKISLRNKWLNDFFPF